MKNTLIDFNNLEINKETHLKNFLNGKPFEVLIIDNFLTDFGLKELNVEKLNRIPSTNATSSDLIFAKSKFENPKIETISKPLRKLKDELLSKRFEAFLQFITNKKVFLDKKFVGGGLHQGGTGSYLDMHADFSRHPQNNNWIREHNLLLYLNHNWNEDYGGSLDLKNSITNEELSIEPIENRMVIMLTKEHTLHGYEKINFPNGILRTSVAAYSYSLDDGSENVPYRSTTWKPKSFFRKLFSNISNKIVPLKQKLFGSRTSKRAE